MPIQQVGETPSALLFRIALHSFRRNIGCEHGHESLHAAGAIVDFLRSGAILGFRPRHRRSARLYRLAKLFQPVAEAQSGKAIIAIVTLDSSTHLIGYRRDSAEFKCTLDDAQV